LKFVNKYKNDIYGAIIGAIFGYFIAIITDSAPLLPILAVAISFGLLCGMPRRQGLVEQARHSHLENNYPYTAGDPGSFISGNASETSYVIGDDQSGYDHSWDASGIDSTGYDSGDDAGDSGGGDGGDGD
jgi:hypothetical protein